MATTRRWTSADLENLPQNGNRYEIIDGELIVSKQPHYYHQRVCGNAFAVLAAWSRETNLGEANFAPGVIFADDDDVAPDVIWISNARLAAALTADGKLHQAPELVIEVLSPGSQNARRDRETKLKLYSRRGVDEYWIMDWQARRGEVFRREQARLQLVCTLYDRDTLATPLLEGFSATVASFFEGIPPQSQSNNL
jgi:Uma2 family endonuclease